jgi:simple sugar transport system ATP-binding protein
VVSRTLDETPGLLVAVNPTRGLDIKATSYVHGKLREAAEQGAAVLLVSGDLDELSEISDRIFFMNRGALFAAGDASSLVGGQG